MKGKAWNKEKVTELLKPFLKLGLSVTRACDYVGIPQTTVSTWIENDKELRLLFKVWQNEIEVEARTVVQKAIQSGDVNSAKWWLERKSKEEFSLKAEKSEGISVFGNRVVMERMNEVLDLIDGKDDEA